MSIQMVALTPDHIIEKEGVYLVRTITTYLENEHWLEARITKNSKGNISIDIHNQTVTHISIGPIRNN